MHLNELKNTMQGQNPADGSSELIMSNVIGSRFLFLVRLCCLSEATYFLHGIHRVIRLDKNDVTYVV